MKKLILAIMACMPLLCAAQGGYFSKYDLVRFDNVSVSNGQTNTSSVAVNGKIEAIIVDVALATTNGASISIATVAGTGASPAAARSLFSNGDVLTNSYNTGVASSNVYCVGDTVRLTAISDNGTNVADVIKAWLVISR
jgi:hypothetical protein